MREESYPRNPPSTWGVTTWPKYVIMMRDGNLKEHVRIFTTRHSDGLGHNEVCIYRSDLHA